jgi:hypothetical protein
VANNSLELLRQLLDAGDFHHATYRCVGSVWEGLWIYRKADTGFRGYEVAASIPKDDPNLDVAYALLHERNIGSSFGSYGNG